MAPDKKRKHSSDSRSDLLEKIRRLVKDRPSKHSSSRSSKKGHNGPRKSRSPRRKSPVKDRSSKASRSPSSSSSSPKSPSRSRSRSDSSSSSCTRSETDNSSSHRSDSSTSESTESTASGKQERKKKDKKEKNKENIDPITLELLGDVPSKEGDLGPDVHRAIQGRWSTILSEGLRKETRKELIKKHPPAANCKTMKAPALNPEIKPALNSTVLRKDYNSSVSQNQLGAALVALGSALTILLAARERDEETELNDDFKKLISDLNEAGLLLTDLQYYMSLCRRASINTTLNPIVKKAAEDTKVDSSLFGKDFAERLKAAQTVERSSKKIVKSSKSRSSFTSSQRPTYEGHSSATRNPTASHLNSTAPSRKPFAPKQSYGHESSRQRGGSTRSRSSREYKK